MLQKQSINFNFTQGVNTKGDPLQIPIGQFLKLENTLFSEPGVFLKRNGFGSLVSLPDTSYSDVTTFNGNLTAIGNSLTAFSENSSAWINKGYINPLQLSVQSLIRSSTNQYQVDTAINNGLVCVVYTDNITSGSNSVSVYKYAVQDVTTGQNIIPPTQLISSFGTVSFFPRVFSLSTNFILVFPAKNGAGTSHLQYMSINAFNTSNVGAITDIATSFQPAIGALGSQTSFDGVVANNSLYLSWNGAANSGLKGTSLSSYLSLGAVNVIASQGCSIVSVCADQSLSTPVIWTAGYASGSNSGIVVATNPSMRPLWSAQSFVNSGTAQVVNIALTAINNTCNLYSEVNNTYNYNSTLSNAINNYSVSGVSGSVTNVGTIVRSVGLASKAFLIGSQGYFLSTYQSPFQSSYFLLNSTGGVVSRLAYGNGGGYLYTGLPSVNITQSSVSFGYLVKDLVASVNKGTALGSQTQTSAIYSQTGLNLATINFGTSSLQTVETANVLHLNGGQLWMYDGDKPVEHNFQLYPDNISLSAQGNTGSVAAQTYYYVATYEWMDNQGNIYRSAPSIPQSITVGSGQTAISINVPTLRLTYKTLNPPKVVIYRWSANQQTYYRVTSIQNPILNDPASDSISFTDLQSDAAILGNDILYTTGGVVEDIAAPAASAMTMFDSRLWLVDAEDPNLLWFSKQVIEGTPVEMSDLLTYFLPPAIGAQGSTGPIKVISPLDDKLIIFKRNAIFYTNGVGPDNTGANSQYSQAILVTSTIGCSNPQSIVTTPQGLMFQSDKGIWLLGRDLSTSYVGAAVDAYNSIPVKSALVAPGTTQVRFTLSSGITLVYDYFYNQWCTFNSPQGTGISSTLYQNLHTFITPQGRAFQETPGVYLDGTNPVLLSFQTGWFNVAGLQGYQRVYKAYLLGTYQSPHKFQFGVAYDYDTTVTQSILVTPTNGNTTWGSDQTWGAGSYWGGNSRREQWQINFQRQQCQSFQINFQEVFDSSQGTPAGSGLVFSGMNIVYGAKKSFPRNIGTPNKIG